MANPKLKIDTPRGSLYTQASKSGKVTASLEWNKGFGTEFTEKFSSAQKFVDSEVLRLDAPYMPIDTGMLIRSGELGTVVGSGEVNYIAPYAGAQDATAPSRIYDPRRGGKWFERMKADHKTAILRGAAKIAGGKK